MPRSSFLFYVWAFGSQTYTLGRTAVSVLGLRQEILPEKSPHCAQSYSHWWKTPSGQILRHMIQCKGSSHLTIHTRIHSGENPYHCSYGECSRKFTNKNDLVRHTRIHQRTTFAMHDLWKAICPEKKTTFFPSESGSYWRKNFNVAELHEHTLKLMKLVPPRVSWLPGSPKHLRTATGPQLFQFIVYIMTLNQK